jgi:polyisoprenoid-binding protein YceI
MKKLAAVLAAALLPALALAAPSTYKPDPAHSTVGFSVKHLVVTTVRGTFAKYDVTIAVDDADVTKSSVEATIDANSIDTREPKRDGHLKSPDFFDTAKYPTLTFKSTKVEKAGAGLNVTGDLTLHGVTKPVVLAVTMTPDIKGMGDVRRAFSATTKIDRKDFGLNWNKAIEATPIVSDEVTIELELETVKGGGKS